MSGLVLQHSIAYFAEASKSLKTKIWEKHFSRFLNMELGPHFQNKICFFIWMWFNTSTIRQVSKMSDFFLHAAMFEEYICFSCMLLVSMFQSPKLTLLIPISGLTIFRNLFGIYTNAKFIQSLVVFALTNAVM